MLPQDIFTTEEMCGPGMPGMTHCDSTTTQIGTLDVSTSTPSTFVADFTEMTLILALGLSVIAALISALFVAKLWK